MLCCLWRIFAPAELRLQSTFSAIKAKFKREHQFVLALVVTVCVMHGGSKPNSGQSQSQNTGGQHNQPSQTTSSSNGQIPRVASLHPVPDAYPAHWGEWEDDTSAANDGIPDEWRRRVHAEFYAWDDIPIEGGLSILEAFWADCDPFMLSTRNWPISDYELLAAGFDPLADFDPAPTCEIDSGDWNCADYQIDITDSTGSGFPDWFEMFWLDSAGENNYDVLVNVQTTRSTALDWGEGLYGYNRGFYITAPGVEFRLRLPRGTNVVLNLIPYPGCLGDEPPPAELEGQFWIANMTVDFVDRSNNQTTNSAFYAFATEPGEIDVIHKEPIQTFTGTYFPPPSWRADVPRAGKSGSSVSWRAGVPRAGNPVVELNNKTCKIKEHNHVWHQGPDEFVGPFTLTNITGVASAEVLWYALHGTMNPMFDYTASLTTYKAYDEQGRIKINAKLTDGTHEATASTYVWPCHPFPFWVTWSTNNFSPHLDEKCYIHVTLPKCPHDGTPLWIEAQVMRETTSGWQHVAWIDVSDAQPGHQKRVEIQGTSHMITWHGIATEGAALAESPDIFTHGTDPFHRALPEVISGEPLPPPYYTVFVRVRAENSDNSPVLHEANETIHIPQVLKVEMSNAAYLEFCRPVIYPFSDWPKIVAEPDNPDNPNLNFYTDMYFGAEGMSKTEVEDIIFGYVEDLIPDNVNVRVTKKNPKGRFKTLKFIKSGEDNRKNNFYGYAPRDPKHWRNENPAGTAFVYVDKMRMGPCLDELKALNRTITQRYSLITVPFDHTNLAKGCATCGTHEFIHTLGLVDDRMFGWDNHNDRSFGYDESWIMNSHQKSNHMYGMYFYKWKSYRPINVLYLEFILPKPQN